MNAELSPDERLSKLAMAIAEPARSRMLCALLDGRSRTATELGVIGEVSASTASTHLARLVEQQLLDCIPQGRHRYYRIASAEVGQALEALLVVAGVPRPAFEPNTPERLRQARTCYDHMAGEVAVALHDGLRKRGWLQDGDEGEASYRVSAKGARHLGDWGVDVEAAQGLRRKFACPCLDWSERRPHLGGALGAAILQAAERRRWIQRELDSRGLRITPKGLREWLEPMDIKLAAPKPARRA